ncbi:FbpB family small basic protein [Bacillus alkalicellulosilyticus]|uniref:FbpB family small basic protein n=1 Tax=Alkalihalobacterium alkalicellulosilyticum TaxID=1912214 RepID=UPI001117145C|nr:FbpB family small basic protein [Bacillus alkalicellulosilyticus]
MRKHSLSFKELVLENKKQLLQDDEAMKLIEQRIEERQANKLKSQTKKVNH